MSKQLRNLEEALNTPLFDRVNKKLKLTASGRMLFSCCQHVFTNLEDCLLDITQQNPKKQQLTLSCEPTIAMKWLIPRLADFNALNHGFDIALLTGGGAVDFQKQSIDIALRRNDFDWGNHIFHERMVDEYIVAVSSGQVQPTETLLLSASRPNLWQHLKKSQLISRDILSYQPMILEHFYLCIEGCLAGLGTAIVSIFMVEKELSSRLLKLADTATPVADSSAYHLLSYTPFHEDDRKMIFKDWLKHQMLDSKQQFMDHAI